MDSEILDWLSHLDPNSRPKSESIVWPPTPRTRGYYFQLKRKAELEAEQQLNQPCAVAKLDFNHLAIMPAGTKGSKEKVASELDNGHQQDNQKGRKDNLDQKAEREARYRRRAERAALISAAEGAGSVSGDSEAERQAEAAHTRAGTEGLAKQQRVEVDNEFAFPDQSWKALTSTPKNSQHMSVSSMASSRSPSNSDSISPPLPMKGIPNLHMLDKPVNWTWLIPGELSTRMENSKLAKLYQSIEGALGKGFLPMELYATLNSKLNLNGESDSLFARRPVRPITPDDLIMTNDERSSFDASLPVQEDEKSKLLGRIHVQSLISEFKALRKIEHWALDRMLELEEASWTGRVHAPMLDLATLHTPSVDAEIVPDAVIMKEYLPKATFQGVARTASLPADRKIIDFAMVLRPDRDDRRIDFFLDTLDHPTFNQSNYYTLEYMPTGVFIVADPHGGKYNETKVQLGIWLASWFDRVSRFPCYDPDDPLPPPDIPLIIIRKQIWELWFGFNQDSEYEICGPIIIGSTDQLLKLYQLLAVLRVLVQWMATDFRKWVDGCLKEAGI